ncbi:MAG: methyltransferase [Myxococcota bacterium]
MSIWWAGKVAAGLFLVLQPVLSLALDGPGPVLRPLLGAGALMGALGSIVHLGHYVLLRRRAGALGRPRTLVTEGGLLPFVRHPMYLGDSVAILGFGLMWPTVIALVVMALGLACAVLQAFREDRQLAHTFPEAHRAWKAKSTLLVPFLF